MGNYHTGIHVYIYICIHIYIYMCIHTNTPASWGVPMRVVTDNCRRPAFESMFVCAWACAYVCACACVRETGCKDNLMHLAFAFVFVWRVLVCERERYREKERQRERERETMRGVVTDICWHPAFAIKGYMDMIYLYIYIYIYVYIYIFYSYIFLC